MRILLQISAAGFALLLVPAIWRELGWTVGPQLAVVFAVYLGVVARERAPTAVFAAICVGYLTDLLLGTPRGLWATTAGLLALAGHLFTSRLLLRGIVMEAVVTALGSLVASVLLGAERMFLGGFLGSAGRELFMALGMAAWTGAFAPPVFWLCRRIDAAFARTQRERMAIREGYFS